ncbi:TRAP transporter substrate-binding protein [Lutimaribacter sp. EGI FJ00015]|uniref:TRAP transporter substrate-binding protein n=1 Tax=Lutimaribacter degradans TaxID=2945989 RepID=A0ACC5ZWA7_9RHOB|nr:TRAP transporter substrate-binding protein [Lutimaribacter sp. EGI FJ00013]MCM2561689.1 TRAP transporter substrate-binding protein [Lutimaribacter sp. EGI FJ00013]MCO0612598.1 TRAP transporter substrate-binding protein [Lutimaribacter sp. EGI FJ00015]MCO0635257.1 TRAP transporter substrate-binding protein [Lutimaribacter sp. EGI FJ00014]
MTMTFTRRALGAILSAVALTSAAQAAEIELKVAWLTADSQSDPYAITAHAFKDELEAALPGRVEVQLFPNRQLGDDKEILEGLQFGTIDMGIITNAVVANLEPSYQLVDLPFLFGSAEQAHEVLDGEVGQQLAANLRQHGVISLGAAEGGFRNMINNSKPVRTPADVEGVKYRTMQNPVFIEMFSSLGGSPVPMAWGEVFTAMQQGTVDGLEIPASVVNSNNYADVTKYLSFTRHTYSAIHLLMSERSLENLPDDVQQAVMDAGHAAIAKQRKAVAAAEADVIKSLEEKGMEINDIEDVGAFRAKVGPVYERFEPTIGSDLLDQALQAVSSD